MDEPRTTNNEPRTMDEPRKEDEIGLLDLAIVLAKRRRLIIGLPLVAAIMAIIYSLLATPIYTGTTKILPPQQQQSTAAAMLGQLGAIAGGAAAGALGLKNPADLYVGMLKSRTVADELVRRFSLMELYEAKYLSDARRSLEQLSTITAGRDGIITIEVQDKDPKRAAALANAYVDELTKLTGVLAVTEAGQRRLFFERQLLQSRDNLVKAEMSARQALNKGGIAMVDEQSRSMVATTAVLRAEISAKEVQIAAMRSFATEENPEFVKARQELGALRQQMAKIEGAGEVSGSVAKRPGSEQGLNNLTLLRDVKYHQVLFDILAKQYEFARIDEAREGAVIQVVDKAIEPDRRSRPKRTLIVILSVLVAGFVSVLSAFAMEALEKAREDSERNARINRFCGYLRWR